VNLRSDSFRPYASIDGKYALVVPDPVHHVVFAANRNPHLAWSAPPAGTRSLAVLCYDPDVPSEGSRVNQVGMTVPVDLPRAEFFHWVLIDLPPKLREIAEGAHSQGVTPRGKPLGPSRSGGRQGLNDYTGWFATDPAMSGDWAGYDGPGPPWNDERVHGYRFAVYALDTPRLELPDRFDGRDVRRAMDGHVLAWDRLVGLYTLRG
jgi:Raf kinase inhibitor-like YbhB/YbcL family protein